MDVRQLMALDQAAAAPMSAEPASSKRQLLSERRTKAVEIDEIDPGDGRVINHDGEQLAISEAADGSIAGCIDGWNPVDRTWYWSCRGSGFDKQGVVLSGPANRAPQTRAPVQAGLQG
ncbi:MULTISPECIES: hypothetical protein [unclassified Mesorhizobium]|uniref:hypothetical protein n=1 Tax=unclassified Mesorhizobium TaxID=325217 RepID=UPI0011271EC8|nr:MULTISPECIES: hypothetical protein [unclassified Mesorhizobium]MBZ9701689.1 hypothetical protein [Mesorhizobium sp. CO1-1-3]MBZ9949037.1 hypothetical protein [Mesorhizobium sp. BR1-1-11]